MRLKLLSTLLGACLSLAAQAQLGGSPIAKDCASAVNVTAIPYNTPLLSKYTTCGDGDTYNSTHACANTFANGEDFMFKFTPTATNKCISISCTAYNNAYGGLFVFDGCPNDTNTNCVAQEINLATDALPTKTVTITNIQLTPGKTYYIMVSSQSDCYQFDLSITAGTCSTPPTGSDCSTAKVIPSVPYQDTGQTTCGKNSYYNQGNTKCFGYGFLDAQSMTYKYTATKNSCIKITGFTDSVYAGMFVYEGCPTDPQSKCVATRTYAFTPMVINTKFTAGKEYYIVINSYAAYTNCVTFDLDIKEIDDKGSVCANAFQFPSNNYTFYDHTNQCKGDDYDTHPGCNPGFNYMNGEEVVYTFNASKGECIGLNLRCLEDYKYSGVYLMNRCPSDPGAKCLAFVGKYMYGQNKVIGVEYTIDSTGTYYVVVGEPYNYNFSYDLTLTSSFVDSVGIDCRRAQTITVPYQQADVNVTCKGNEYDNLDACKSNYMAGNDYVMKFTAPRNECVQITAKNILGVGGIFLTDSCPDRPGANCLASGVSDYTPCDSISFIYTLTAGKTYYLITAAYSGGIAFSCDLNIDTLPKSTACTYCATNVCVACQNVGFERMDFTGWKGYTGDITNPKATAGINSGAVNNGDTRHTIMSAGSYDPMVGEELSVVSPSGGKYSVRLGNRLSGSQGEMLEYSFTVDSNTMNFFYYYAVVFQDPGTSHTVEQKPYFKVQMLNQAGTEIQCAHFEVRAGPNIPGFKSTKNNAEGIWKDWTLVAVPLNTYLGQTVTIQFTTLDCSQGGHFGYAYIDAFCGDISINSSNEFICPGGSVTLTAPDGFKSYKWSNGPTTQSISVNAANTYTVELTPFADSTLGSASCKVSLKYTVKPAPDPVPAFEVIEGCKDSLVTLVDRTAYPPGFEMKTRIWTFSDSSGHPVDSVLEHGFPGPGTYDVYLNICNVAGCKKEIKKQVKIDPYPFLPPLNTTDTIKLCEKMSTQFYADSIKDTKYKWWGPAGFNSTIRTPNLTNVKPLNSGTYYVQATLQTDTCVKKLDSTYIDVTPFPDFGRSKDTAVCFSEDSLKLFAKGGTEYLWSPSQYINNKLEDTVMVNISDDRTFTVKIMNDLCPDTTLDIIVTKIRHVKDLDAGPDIMVCVFDSVQFGVTGNPMTWIEWDGPNGFYSNDLDPYIDSVTMADSGDYVVTAYLGPNNFCPYDRDTMTLLVSLNPNLIIANSPKICPGDSVIMTVSGADEYSWSYADYIEFSNKSAVMLKPDSSVKVYARGYDIRGCKGTSQATITVKEKFKPDIGPDASLCKGQSHTLTLNSASFYKTPDKITWSTGASGNSITVTTSGTYWAEVTVENCTKYDSAIVTFQDPASFTLGPDTLLCQGSTHTLDLSSYGNNVSWTDGSKDNVRVISYPGGNYNVSIVSGLCVLKDDINVNFQDQHAVSIGPDSTLCKGGSLTLFTGQSSGQHEWTDGTLKSSTPTYTVNAEGNHNVSVIHTIGVCKATDAAVITVETPPVPDLGPDSTVCENQSIVLSPKVPNANAYLWSDLSTSPTLTVSQPGNYFVEVTRGTCKASDTINIYHDKIPVMTLGPDSTICENQNMGLDATVTGNPTYLWSTGETTAQITINAAKKYNVLVSRGKCTYRDTMELFVDLIPTFDLGPTQNRCQHDSVVLSSGITNSKYTWSTSDTTYSIKVGASNQYKLRVDRGKCFYEDSVAINFQVPPVLNLGPDQTRCQGDSVRFGTAISASTYTWNTGASTDSVTAKNQGNYILEILVGVCRVKDTVRLNIDIPPVVNLGNDTTNCDTINLVLNATIAGATYLWQDNSTQPTFTVSGKGIYSVAVTKGTCTRSSDIEVKIQDQHSVILPADEVLCIGTSKTIYAATDAATPQYLWNTGQNIKYITVSTTDWYWLEVSSGVCTNRDSVLIQFIAPPVVDLGPPQLHCFGDSVILVATNTGASYEWSTGEDTPTIVAKTTGLYGVRAYIGPCEDKDNVMLTFQDPPVLDLGPDTEICAGKFYPVDGTVKGNANYQWSNQQTVPKQLLQRTGLYILTITQGPCVVVDSIRLTVHALPPINVRDTMICPTDSAYLNAWCEGCTYLWSDGITDAGRWSPARRIYDVIITNEFGCVVTPQVNVRQDEECWDEIFVPNTFTPNHDGVNDLFKVRYGNVTILDILIADRWGHVLYQSSNPDEGWDGTYRGAIVKEDTYVWKVTYNNMYDHNKQIFGHINLLK